jgi:hypothetical protein
MVHGTHADGNESAKGAIDHVSPYVRIADYRSKGATAESTPNVVLSAGCCKGKLKTEKLN